MMGNLIDYYYSSPDFSMTSDSFIPLPWDVGIYSVVTGLIKRLLKNNPWVTADQVSFILGSSLFEINNFEARPQDMMNKVADTFHFSKLRFCVSNTCVTAVDAIGLSERLLQNAMAQTCIVVLFDYASDFIRKGFASLNILSEHDDLQIYHRDCKGTVLATAAVVCLITGNKMKPKAKIIDARTINDAYALSGLSPGNTGTHKAVTLLLKKNGRSINQITAVLCSANGVWANDIRYLMLLQELGYTGIISSVKNITRHSLGATILIELCVFLDLLSKRQFTTECFRYQLDTEKKPDILPIMQTVTQGTFLSLGTGFGGIAGALLFEV